MAGYSCEEVSRRLDAYVDGELAETEARAVEEHLAACPRCAGPLAFERALLGGLKRSLREAEVPPGLRTRIRSALDGDPSENGRRKNGTKETRSEG